MTKRNYTSPLLNYAKGNTSRFGFAMQVLPSDILEYFKSFFITVAVVFLFMFLGRIDKKLSTRLVDLGL